MKKLYAVVLAAVILLSTLCAGTISLTISADEVAGATVSTLSHADEPTFEVSKTYARVGDTVTVAVRMENNPGIVSWRLQLEYDDTVMTLVSAEEQAFTDVVFGPLTSNPIYMLWTDAIHPDVTTDGVVALFTFAVREDAPVGESALALNVVDPEDIYNAEWDTVPFTIISSTMNVVDYIPGDVNRDGSVNNRDMVILRRYLAMWPDVTVHEDAADVTGDGKVNTRDLGLLQQYINTWDVTLEYGGAFVVPPSTTVTTTTTQITQTTTRIPNTTSPAQPTIVHTTTSATTTTPVSGGNPLEDTPDELSGTKIKMLIWWTESDDDKAKAAKMKEETGIEVSYATTSYDKYQTYLSSTVMARNAPAMAAITNEWYPQPITRMMMQPISNVEGWNFKDSSVYATSLMDQFGYKGEHYGIAIKGSISNTFHVMFFNKKILSQCGVKEDPYQLWKAGNWNWDTCLEIAQKCTAGSLHGITNVGQYVWMLSAGQDFVKTTRAGLKNNIKSSELLYTWNWTWDLINTYKVVDTSFTGQTPFYQGKAAMLGAGSYMMQAEASRANYVPQNMTDDWSVVPFPSPQGMNVAACDGTVWGFPQTVYGKQLQAAAWYLRYYLDDYNNPDMLDDFYPVDKPECWEVINWMWDQTIQSYNSVGVLTYGGEYTAYSIQYSLVDESDTKAKLKSNLDQWYGVLDANIRKIENELS